MGGLEVIIYRPRKFSAGVFESNKAAQNISLKPCSLEKEAIRTADHMYANAIFLRTCSEKLLLGRWKERAR